MMRQAAHRDVVVEGIAMPDQALHLPFTDVATPGLSHRRVPYAARATVLFVVITFAAVIFATLTLAFHNDSQLSLIELCLITLITLLAGWEAVSTATAVLGFLTPQHPTESVAGSFLTVALLVTMRDEPAQAVLPKQIALLRSLQNQTGHRFSLHVLSDSRVSTLIEDERRLVRLAQPLPVFYRNRKVNTDFKAGNIRDWIETNGGAYDAIITLDADSELDDQTALILANSLARDPACGLIQTLPLVQSGQTLWQNMQSIASDICSGLQGRGLAAWMGDEANYFGHNAIIRTKAFAASAGLPHITRRGLWRGPIISHDFVEAALMRRAGWSVRFLPISSGSYEQAPQDMIAHLKRDARWCLGNFQHSRLIRSAGLHSLSRLHLLNGIFSYLSSAVWLAVILLWATLDATQSGVGGTLATAAFLLIGFNLLLPRVLGSVDALRFRRAKALSIISAVVVETVFSSLLAPALLLQRVKIIMLTFLRRELLWPAPDKTDRSFLDYWAFHASEFVLGLGLLACVERQFLSPWFLPLAICFGVTPLLSYFSAQPARSSHTKN
jgi:membrane glycosyltransferase